jgi:hypothetical protein
MSARKTKTETTVVAYKGTDKDMACRGFAFELGKAYEHDGKVVACQSGFHACENPFDVWSYYGPADGNRFFRVTLGGELSRHGTMESGPGLLLVMSERTALRLVCGIVLRPESW